MLGISCAGDMTVNRQAKPLVLTFWFLVVGRWKMNKYIYSVNTIEKRKKKEVGSAWK